MIDAFRKVCRKGIGNDNCATLSHLAAQLVGQRRTAKHPLSEKLLQIWPILDRQVRPEQAAIDKLRRSCGRDVAWSLLAPVCAGERRYGIPEVVFATETDVLTPGLPMFVMVTCS
jgi:hypothetical protein